MTRYFYSLVRCVPSPRTGEFINIAAIAGSEESGEWSIRQIQNESRAKKLCSADDLAVVHGFLASSWEAIDRHDPEALLADEPLTLEWLRRLHHDHRNVVQLSEPMPIVGEGVEGALDVVFDHLLIDPVRGRREFITKHRVLAALRDSYGAAEIPAVLCQQRVETSYGPVRRLHPGWDRSAHGSGRAGGRVTAPGRWVSRSAARPPVPSGRLAARGTARRPSRSRARRPGRCPVAPGSVQA